MRSTKFVVSPSKSYRFFKQHVALITEKRGRNDPQRTSTVKLELLKRGTILHPKRTPWTGPLQDPPKPVIEMNPDLPKQRWEATKKW